MKQMFSTDDHDFLPEGIHWLKKALIRSLTIAGISMSGQLTGYAQDGTTSSNPPQQEPMISPALEALKRLGDQYVQGNAWQSIWSQRNSYLSHLQNIRKALETGRKAALAQRFSEAPSQQIDPWGDLDQPVNYTPPLGPLRFWTGRRAETPMPEGVARAIPSRYRLAEAMGIGINTVYLGMSVEDGQLFSSVPYGFHIAARERFSLAGLFRINNIETPIHTFQQSILSRGRESTQDIQLGPDVKPHQVQLNRYSIEDLPKRNGTTLWAQENLYLKYPSDFSTTTLSPKDRQEQLPLEEKLEQIIRDNFRMLRKAVIDAQWTMLEMQGYLDNLDQLHHLFTEWESPHHKEANCPMKLKANDLITSSNLKTRIESQIDSDEAWVLGRATITHMEHTLNASLAHGLAHRVPSSTKEEIFKNYLALLEEVTWKN
ncbi:MAG: hypothetical protein ACFHW5_14800 [Verrucomicrobiota bacterium]